MIDGIDVPIGECVEVDCRLVVGVVVDVVILRGVSDEFVVIFVVNMVVV